MKTCIVSLGDEILSGRVINSNAAFLAARVTEEGFSVAMQVVLSDFDPTNEDTISALSKDYSLMILSGGLGPTMDDLTRDLMAKLLGSPLVFNKAVYEDLNARFGTNLYHRLQAHVPEGAKLLKNKWGKAPGVYFEMNGCLIIALPGVPHELKNMFEIEALPILKEAFPPNEPFYEKRVYFFDLEEGQIDPFIKKIRLEYPHLQYGIYPGYGVVTLVIKGAPLMDVEKVAGFFTTTFQNHIFTAINGKIEQGLFQVLKAQHKKIALAESISGGAIASRLVSLPGISSVFVGSMVTYSNLCKQTLLDVHPTLIKKYGAVSAEVAEAMCLGLFGKTDADVGIAVSGIAGPDGGSVDKPVGLVYIAIGEKGKKPIVYRSLFTGDRGVIIEKTTTYAIGYLLRYLLEGP